MMMMSWNLALPYPAMIMMKAMMEIRFLSLLQRKSTFAWWVAAELLFEGRPSIVNQLK